MTVTYHDVYQFRDVSVRERLQNVNLALEILEQLGSEDTSTDRLDSYLLVGLLMSAVRSAFWRALETALGSLGMISNIYEQREARWRDEMRRLNGDRERVELVLNQALGPLMNAHMNGSAGGQ